MYRYEYSHTNRARSRAQRRLISSFVRLSVHFPANKVNQVDGRCATLQKMYQFCCRELLGCAPLQQNCYFFWKVIYLPSIWLTLWSPYHLPPLPTTSHHLSPPLTTSNHCLPPPTTSYHFLSLPTTSYHFRLLPTTSYHFRPLPITSYHFLSLPITFYHFLSLSITSYHFL